MRIVGADGDPSRVVDHLRSGLAAGSWLDVVTPELSVFAFEELAAALAGLSRARILLPMPSADLGFMGSLSDRAARNRLNGRWLARNFADWIDRAVEVRCADGTVPQGLFVVRDGKAASYGIQGSVSFTSRGLGLAPDAAVGMAVLFDSPPEAGQIAGWFETTWNGVRPRPQEKEQLVAALNDLGQYRTPRSVYALMLHHLFQADGGSLDEDKIVDAATGIRDTVVWQKLYKFQRDGVVSAIDKLDRYGGCIIADSVGLGKTFEALAVIKYYELRNSRVLVLCPKRLRDNWTVYAANDRRNLLASDRFNYDVLNHTDLSRDSGKSGDLNLATINWGNYDLVVIDESHNFRNKLTPQQGGETRYDRLMRQIIQEGIKTRVLMLSATPVNNRIADLRNQIAFATEGDDEALASKGIASINATTQRAQKQFNSWQDLAPVERTPDKLVEMLGFDYFTLLDQLTIARSRRHIEKYYGTNETGRFPERLKPENIKTDVDSGGEFRPIAEINEEIRRLNLASYRPMSYVLPDKKAYYEEKYATRLKSGKGSFRQSDRELSLIHLLRVNILKRLESSVHAFALTIERQLADVEQRLGDISRQVADIAEIDLDEQANDDDVFAETLRVGTKIEVRLKDLDLRRWRQDLEEDRESLSALLAMARAVQPDRDAKLERLRTVVTDKCSQPINAGNRKIIVFTASADTARYLYDQLAPWAAIELGLETALVTGAGSNRTTVPNMKRDLATLLTAFAPRAKQRPESLSGEGEIDLLIATDCISEGQNLQDCDWLINYDIHWNPVRIIQRFGRIDRIGSPNETIQLVNFWPNVELDEYIDLERRVSGRMVLLDVSATGEDNVIHRDAGDPMNDLEYRRVQLLKMQDTVIDLEDLSTGVSIADLTLTDFRIDLAEYEKEHPGYLAAQPLGACAVTTADVAEVPPGIVFCLRAEDKAAEPASANGYPLAPYYVVHAGENGVVHLPYTQAKQILDRVKAVSLVGGPSVDQKYDTQTKSGRDMKSARQLLATAIRSVIGKNQERAVASLFSTGGTIGLPGEFAGADDFEVLAYLVLLPEADS